MRGSSRRMGSRTVTGDRTVVWWAFGVTPPHRPFVRATGRGLATDGRGRQRGAASRYATSASSLADQPERPPDDEGPRTVVARGGCDPGRDPSDGDEWHHLSRLRAVAPPTGDVIGAEREAGFERGAPRSLRRPGSRDQRRNRNLAARSYRRAAPARSRSG